jgi:hypothetical protein
MLQSFRDEFELPEGNDNPVTPAVAGEVLQPCDPEHQLADKEQVTYRQGVGKLLHLMRWSRPDVLNSVRELTRFAGRASMAHMKAMYRVMKFCRATKKRGKTLKPRRNWDETKDYEFEILGRSDSDYAKDPIGRRSVSGFSVFLEGAPVIEKSKMQSCVTLSVSEAEYVAAGECVQDMMFTMRPLESVGLKVKKPMIIEMDNKGAIDLTTNWSASGRTRHIDVRHHFMRELKEEGVIQPV